MKTRLPHLVVPAAAVLGLAAFGALSSAAEAKDGAVIRSGACSAAAEWKVKVSPEDGRLEVEGEVDASRSGQSWRWTLKQNDVVVGSGTQTTRGRSGSFTVRRVVVDRPGSDRIVFVAVRPRSGEICRGSLTY